MFKYSWDEEKRFKKNKIQLFVLVTDAPVKQARVFVIDKFFKDKHNICW
jgi:hypothetical protein